MPIALPKLLLRSTRVSLRWVLTVPFVLLTFGTTTLVGYLSYRSGQETARSLGDQLVAQTNEQVTQKLKLYLQTPLLINRLNVDAVNQGQLDLQNTQALEAALFNRSQQFDQVTAILFVTAQGRLRLFERLPSGLYSAETDPSRPDKIRIYPLDKDGKRKQLVTKNNLDVRNRPWYRRAVTDRKLGWNAISQYGSSEALTLTAAQPVYDSFGVQGKRATNNLLGVFAVHLRLDYLSQFLNRLDISRAGQVIITDQTGSLVATSTGEKPYTVGGGIAAWQQFKQLKIDESQNGLTRSLGEHLRNRSIDQPQFLEFKYNGDLYYVKIAPFRDAYGLDWRILTVIPKSHFMGAIGRNAATTALLNALALGAAIALGVYAAKKFSDRFAQFNQASQALAAGKLDQRLPPHSISELNGLSQTFNQMADQLQHAFDRLKTDLAESEEKFAGIFHSSPDPIALISTEGRCVEANESFLNLLEYSCEALIGQVFVDLGVWVNLEERAHLVQALNQQGFVRNLEMQLVTRTQQIKTVLISAELIELNDKIYTLNIVRDISDRKLIEAALQESEARFRQLAETVQEGFFVYETETNRYSYVNPAYSRIKGESSQVIYEGMHRWLDYIHPDDLERIKAALERERQGENFDEEYRYIRPDGETRWLRSKAFPIQNEAGTVIRVVGTFDDITEAKQRQAEREAAEQALKQAEERFRRAFDDAPIGISLIAPTGQFLKANPCYCDLLGYTEAELMALTFQAITHPADQDKDMEGFQQMLTGEIRSFKMEKRYITKQGGIVPVVLNAAPIRDQVGQVLYIVGHIQDVRDRLKVERMKDEFISVVSHELRTPLTSIRGSLGILESGVFRDRPEKAQQMLQIAVNNSDRLVRLVNDILTLERLESGKAPLMMEFCQIPDLMQQAVNSVQTLADQSGVALCVTPLSSTLWAAPDAIVQTLTNLLSNAIKFSTSGDTVWIKAEAIVPEACRASKQFCISEQRVNLLMPYILFIVKDQGRGIPQDKLDVIFEQFQQVDVSDSRKKGGTGLGLAICKQIVQQHHGQIWVESNLGEGSTFYFALPSIAETKNC